ncbi:MAG TPA: NAD(P)/FAD-dependent oxidoreductase [Polyangiales bacterium]|nr:NAD(P)/FAD-dependent oxidoreductase [Polyangiales bacterium]
MRVVIIGNGVAGMEAALCVRGRQPDWDVTIVSEESDHYFSRTALMWVFCGQMSQQDIEPLERDAYERLGFRRVRARAVGLDTDEKKVLLAGGLEPLDYDRLLIASGSIPRPGPWPGSDLRGTGHFVTMQDLAWYEAEVHGGESRGGRPPRHDAHLARTTEKSPYRFREAAAARRGRLAERPAVIGGGLIGIEAIEIAVASGLRPHFFIREDWFWPIALEPRESAWIGERLTEHGVQVHLDHEVEAIEGDDAGNVQGVRTDRGVYDADCVVVAIGVMPNTEWLRDSSIELDERAGGIIVDECLNTSAKDVFAAGDCAAVRWFEGSVRPEQLWYTARDQGRIAGRRLLGDEVQYERGIWYNSAKLMDIEYTTVGLVNWNVEREQNWFYEEEGRVRSTTRIVVQDDRVVGFNLLGRRWDHSVLIRWLEQRRSLDWVLDHLERARFDTELVPRLRIPKGKARPTLEGPAPNPAIAGPTKVPF